MSVINGFIRSTNKSNTWIADFEDLQPELKFSWNEPQQLSNVTLYSDTDYDHPMESLQREHPENRIPFCIRSFRLLTEKNELIAEVTDNYQMVHRIDFAEPVKISRLVLQMHKTEK